MKTWQVQEAKTHFSEVIERAQSEGPQTITRHGKPRAVVLSAKEYDALAKDKPVEPKQDFVDFLLSSGPIFEGVDLARSKDTGRDFDFE